MPDETSFVPLVVICPACGTEIAAGLLTCPSCLRLVHAEPLKRLAGAAAQAETAGDTSQALALWRKAQSFLPPESRQHATIATKIAALERQQATPQPSRDFKPAGPGQPAHNSGWKAGAAGLGTLALLAWKFKVVALFALTKGKFLLLGLTKASTFFSMALAFGVYWQVYGWKFALGLVISIYIHEMGHVAALLGYGIKASAPLFIPGIGAVVRLQQAIDDPRKDARIGLAGPLWGLAAALAAYGAFVATRAPIWAAIAKYGALINLFNLLPFWQLDGGRAFHSLSRPQRWLAALLLGVIWGLTSEGLVLLLLIVAMMQAMDRKAPSTPDYGALNLYAFLVAAFSLLIQVPAPRPG
jgi:Zn-dependent protease